MAGDLEYLATLDDRQFQAAMKRLDSTIEAERAKMDRGFLGKQMDKEVLGLNKLGKAVGVGLAGSFALAGKAVSDYADRSSTARTELEQLGFAKDRLFDSIGQEVVASGAVDVLTESVRALGDAYKWAADKAREFAGIGSRAPKAAKGIWEAISDFAGTPVGTPGAFGAAVDRMKFAVGSAIVGGQRDSLDTRSALNSQSAFDVQQRLRESMTLKSDAFSGAGLTDVGKARAQAAAMEREAARFAAAQAKIAVASGMSINDADKITSKYLEGASRAANDLIRAAEMAKSRKDQDESDRRNAVYDAVAGDRQRAALSIMRAKGLDKQADAAEIELGYQEKILKVLSDQNLNYIQRFDLVQGLDEARKGELAAIAIEAARAKGATTLDAGLGGSGAAAIVFGVGGSGGNELLNVQKKSGETLRRIEELMRRSPGATFN